MSPDAASAAIVEGATAWIATWAPIAASQSRRAASSAPSASMAASSCS